jgi:hypothetical protein
MMKYSRVSWASRCLLNELANHITNELLILLRAASATRQMSINAWNNMPRPKSAIVTKMRSSKNLQLRLALLALINHLNLNLTIPRREVRIRPARHNQTLRPDTLQRLLQVAFSRLTPLSLSHLPASIVSTDIPILPRPQQTEQVIRVPSSESFRPVRLQVLLQCLAIAGVFGLPALLTKPLLI